MTNRGVLNRNFLGIRIFLIINQILYVRSFSTRSTSSKKEQETGSLCNASCVSREELLWDAGDSIFQSFNCVEPSMIFFFETNCALKKLTF